MGFHGLGISIGNFLSSSLGDSLILPRIFFSIQKKQEELG